MSTLVEIEIDGSRNESLHFRPLIRNIRGRCDLGRMGEPMAHAAAAKWPLPIPSQRLGIDSDGVGYIRETLHDPEHAALKEKITKTAKLEPALTTFGKVDLPTWLWWIKQAVESGLAKIVSGKLPDKIEGKVRMDFINADTGPSQQDRFAAVLDAQTKAFNNLADAINKLVAKK